MAGSLIPGETLHECKTQSSDDPPPRGVRGLTDLYGLSGQLRTALGVY